MSNNQKPRRNVIVSGLVGVAVLIGGWMWLNAGYGKISYPAYQTATALYGACLAKSDARVAKVRRLISRTSTSDGADDNEAGPADLDLSKITYQEHAWLRSIITQAENGRWEAAAAAAKQMMDEQIVRR